MSFGVLLNFVWALLLVLVLAYVALRVVGRSGFLKRSPARFMEQVDYLPLGPKRGIAIVQVVDKMVAVGISEAGIQLLQEVSPEAIRARASSIESAPAFGDELMRLLRRRSSEDAE